MSLSKIEWTECTWNPLTGCTKFSIGCNNCYAEKMSNRLKAMGVKNYSNGFKLTLHEDTLSIPMSWKKPRMIFVNSMSDLFHEDVPDDFIVKVFKTMNLTQMHTFQILTKRSERLKKMSSVLTWTNNIWMGVTVESIMYKQRVNDLISTDAYIKYLSLEPLLDDVQGIDINGIDWVIVGGESGPGARLMKEEWVKNIKTLCVDRSIPFFFKQWGGVNKKKTGRLLDGKTWNQMPVK
ncbi:MAG: phage Gp37/Gp68 family protein [Desulfovibrionaceae bacterium]|nr:phage Gp37/Gp68 family protein [Desulfovibrionaceae bacterium]